MLIAAPYIKKGAVTWLIGGLEQRAEQSRIEGTVLTDISPESVLGGSLDIDALLLLGDHFAQLEIVDVDRLHAKVYATDKRRAIVTSGNLTSAALGANYEYGVLLEDPEVVSAIYDDMASYAGAGRSVRPSQLIKLQAAASRFRDEYKGRLESTTSELRGDLAREWARLSPPVAKAKGSARFKGPVLEVLASRGPLATAELCDAVQDAWPELCDDSVMRVAKDGSRKRQWRHDIHTAQETLQRARLLFRDANGKWHLR